MSPKIHRSAGSHSPLEKWLDRAGIKRRDPARDVEAFGQGQAFKVFCLVWTLGQVRKRRVGAAEVVMPKGGWLIVVPGGETTWKSASTGETVAIPPQAALAPSPRPLYYRNQAAFTVVTADGEHDIAIRRIDEALVRLALVTSVAA
ncbi:hypothetical protein [Actinoplanes sp. HUAS TT8]|uniref:hypothetical protein n=1 Tax=Actinoplanes sp. HUAS TT8 TaxID=3447453 RepID=UPI003F5273C6